MGEQVGWRGFMKALKAEAPHYATLLPQLPRLLHQKLLDDSPAKIEIVLRQLLQQQMMRNRLLGICVVLLLSLMAWSVYIN